MAESESSAGRRELLESLIRQRREQRRVRPVSFAQRRFWFLDQLLNRDPVYNVISAYRIRGRVDVAILERAMDEIVARHEVLRTTFGVRDGEPVQQIGDPGPVGLEVTEPPAASGAERDAEIKRNARELGSESFDLARGPLLRVRLVKLAEDDHALVIATHHIAYDGWSSGVLLRELSALYDAFSAGKASPLAPLPIQYGDFGERQREELRDERLESHLAYWRQHLAGLSPLDLPTDRARPRVPKYESERQFVTLSPSVAEGLERLSRSAGATMFATVLTILKVLLHRYAAQDDIVVGAPIAGRNRPETETLIGCFVNSLVLRTDLSGNPTLRQLLMRVRETVLAAFEHEELPFEKLVEALQPERDTSRNPFFQVLYSYQGLTDFQESRGEAAGLAGLALMPVELDSGTTRLDIEFYAFRAPDGLRILVNYRKDLFERDTMQRMLRHFEVLTRSAVENPDAPISRLPLLDADERRLVLETWNDRPMELPDERTIHELVAAQAARTPDKVAVVFGDERLTFAEVRQGAMRLAAHLRSLGLGPGDLAGIYIERSPRMVVALLGVLEAGAAYVPLDPSYPSDRIAFMLDDAKVRVLLTTGDLGSRLPPHSARDVCLDRDDWLSTPEKVAANGRAAGPDDLAYVMYTSGSTGKPKGVKIPHRCVVNLLTSMRREPGLGPDDVLLSITTLSFDISVLEVYLPLMVGARLVLVPRGEAGDGERLKRRVAETGATFLQATPATWRLLVEAGWRGDGRLTAVAGGEAWGWDLAGPMVESCGSVWNGYGPTETTVYASMRAVRPGEGRVDMGGPVANCALYILDEEREPVPIGVPGELYIGGAGVGLGYWNRADLTAEKFVPNPFDAAPGARLYRTGDKVRYRADGTVQFMGRLDHQVKLRGFRIEPGEIQNALLQVPSVKDAVVTLREDRPGDQRLVAYVVTNGSELEPASELRAFLRQYLPEYMLPSRFVRMESLPLTPSGKTDRKALPPPEKDALGTRAGRVEPSGAIEELVANICASVLGVKSVGALDNFFELGGHSLLATQVVSRVRDSFGVDLSLLEFFDEPTVSGIAQRVEMGRSLPPSAKLPLSRAEAGAPRVLSFGQERFWFLEQMRQGTIAFNIHEAVRIVGAIDAAALRQALTEVARRHETLRASFPKDASGNPACRISDPGPFDLGETDLTELDAAAREERVLELAAEESRTSFDIAAGPIARARLVRLGPRDHVFLFTVHHIVSDGWSMGLFWKELMTFYAAFAKGEEPAWTEPRIRYGDYAAWQRAFFTDERVAEELEYWTNQLRGAPPLLELPADRPRPAVEGSNGSRISRALTPQLTRALRELAERHDATLFMVLLACFKALLHRQTTQPDIVVGVPIAGRTRAETEDLIGLFVNSVVLRTDLTGDPSFLALLKRVRAVSLGALAHQELPFERLVQALRPPRDLSHHPLFQVMFTLQNAPRENVPLTGLEVRPVGAKATTSQFDLTLFAWEAGGALTLTAVYKTDLFDEETIASMLDQLETLMEGAVADPKLPLSRLPLLDVKSSERLLAQWSGAAKEFPVVRCLHERFEEQADRDPDAIAVTCEGEHLTYGELDVRANRLARVLRERGVGPDVLVGLCFERGLDMLVGVLGILKAGGAYVPLDLANPAERIAIILEDSQLPILVTESSRLEKLPPHTADVICLDRDRGLLEAASASRLGRVAAPEHLAYVIYTSGSTGRPKGVQIEHRQAVRLFDATHDLYEFDSSDVWSLFHSIAFDVSVYEIWGALFYGGRIVVVPYMTSRSPEEFRKLLVREKVTVLSQTPSAFRALIPADLRAGVDGELALRWIIFAGEALDLQSLAPWFERHGESKPRLVNMYGITETTVHVTWREIKSRDLTEAPGSVIGPPMPDLRIRVLDAHRQPVPIGVPGEIYVGGAGVARGYLRRPELTAERFIADPFSTVPGARLYKSGDMARLTHRGELLYLGRNDDQVKIRGFRIELGEIRAALDKSPQLTANAVVIRGDPGGAPRIVAYAVPAPGAKPSLTELRAFLKSQLPEYMVPAAIVFLQALPLTPNGKLDRSALPSPEPDRESAQEDDARPRTPTEEILGRIWGDLLHLKHVGMHANFFELGGHSLVATRVTSRVRDSFGVELPLTALFEDPTLAGLAARIEALLRRGGRIPVPALTPAAGGSEPVLSFGQERFWFLEQLQSSTSAFNIPNAGRLSGDLDVAALRKTLTDIVRRHAALRSSFPKDEDGNPRCVVAEPAPFDLPETDLTSLGEASREDRLREIVEREIRAPFRIDTGPLLRARLIRLAPKEHAFVLTFHHMVSDGWSLGIFWREFVTLYGAFTAGKPSPLTDLPIRYSDVAHWQRKWLTDERLAEQMDYWESQLRGIPPLLELPTDRPRPSVERFDGSTRVRRFGSDLTRALRDLALRQDATLFMVLLAGFKALLQRFTSQTDIVVGVPVAGRTRAEMEDLIGLFVNSLVLRTDLTGDPTFAELLTRVRGVSLGAFAHQEMPFERLVQVLRPPRDLSHHPVFQVLFSLQNAPRPNEPIPGVQLQTLSMEGTTSQFDLALHVTEIGDELRLGAIYKADLFDSSTIDGILERLETLLQGAVADPSQPISRLPLLTAEARNRVLEEWNTADAPEPASTTVHAMVRSQAARTPDAVAVEFEGQRLTYAQLGRQASAVAARLRSMGIRRGSRVGICLERSLAIPAALLGILESGAAYVPLDPSHPAERTNFIIGDAGLDVLLTHSDLAPRFESQGVRLLMPDRESPDPSLLTSASADVSLSSDDLAYVIYTSGSTGRPKGVRIPHRAVVNFLASMRRTPGLRADDVLLSVTTLSFDIAALELFGPLSVGARVILVPASVASDGLQLEAKLAQTRATVCQATPATWRLLLEAGWVGDRRLKILCGGEAWTRAMADQLLPRCGSLWNMYGPTETTIWSAVQRVEAGSAPVAIGVPIANTRLYVLDEHLQPLPIGVPGELCIGGAGVADGYLNRPELTAERFVSDPFVAESGARLYRTGDRVRRRADGTIEFLGRLDHQVKVNGFRIELGEIESVLAGHPQVRESVVTAREFGPGDRRLVAYVVCDPDERPKPEELQAHLRARLPDYMVPAAFVMPDALPRTPNGKIDRAALPAPMAARPRTEEASLLPSTPLEKQLAAIWRDLLGVEQVSVRDNFFDLGGHSLLSMRVVARLEREAGVRIRPGELILQTLGQVASLGERAMAKPAEPPRRRPGWIRKIFGGGDSPRGGP